ncbi:MAG TPA: Ig-like domain-containing protein, partial [Edaphobacter sp.]|nr:Ig-like domain-containing protein [Edaphobacter sp.]
MPLFSLVRYSIQVSFLCLVALLMPSLCSRVSQAQDLVTITSPSVSHTYSSSPVSVSLQLGANADSTRLKVLLNGKSVTANFSACSASSCTAALSTADGLRAGANVLSVVVGGPNHSLGSDHVRFRYQDGLTAAPPATPAMVQFKVAPEGEYEYLYVGGQKYPSSEPQCPTDYFLEVMAFNRQTLAPDPAGLLCIQNDAMVLSATLGRFTSNELVVVHAVLNEASAALIDHLDTTSIGGSNNLSSISPDVCNYMAIGVPGAAPGTAYESYNYCNAAAPNRLSGVLVQDPSGNYQFHASNLPEFYIVPNGSNGQSYFTWGDLDALPTTAPNPIPPQTYYATTVPAGGRGGFWLLELDRSNLQAVFNSTYGTFNDNESNAQSETQRLASDLKAASPENLIILTTVGLPMNHVTTAQLYSAIELLGGTGRTINDLYMHMNDSVTPTYTLISSSDPNMPKSRSAVSTTIFTQQNETGILRGVLSRDRHSNLYEPLQANQISATDAANSNFPNFALHRIAWAPPVAWPLTSAPGALLNAYQWLSVQVYEQWINDQCTVITDCQDLRAIYQSGQNTFLEDKDTTVFTYPAGNPNFSPADLQAVETQINEELKLLKNAINAQTTFQDIFAAQQVNVNVYTVLSDAATKVKASIDAPDNYGISFNADDINMLAGATTVLAAVAPETAPLSGSISGLLTIAGAADDSGGNAIPTGTFQTTVGNLQTDLENHAGDMLTNTDIEFDNIYSDWFKLHAVGQLNGNRTPGWYLPNQDAANGSVSYYIEGVKTLLYKQFMSALYNVDAFYGSPTAYPYRIGGEVAVTNPFGTSRYICESMYPTTLPAYSWIDYPSLTSDISQASGGTDVLIIGGARSGGVFPGENFPSADLLTTIFGATDISQNTSANLNWPVDWLFSVTGPLPRRDGYLPPAGGNPCFNANEDSVSPGVMPTTTSLQASSESVLAGTSVTLTARVQGNSTVRRNGSVRFNDGTAVLGEATLDSSGAAALSVSNLALGTHTVVARYQGDAIYAPSGSSAVGLNVHGAPDFTLSTPATMTVDSAGIAAANVTVSGLNTFTGDVQLTCSGLPADSKCILLPSTVTVGSTPATSSLTITTGVKSTANVSRNSILAAGVAFWGALLLLPLRRRYGFRLLSIWLVLLSASTLLL